MRVTIALPLEVQLELARVRASERIAVGLSGGVDSSATALLLAAAGFEVVGLTMRIWDGAVQIRESGRSGCYGPGEVRDLQRLREFTARLGIPLHEVSLASDYQRDVLEYVRAEYRRGRTPNPCVWCNRRVKLGRLLEAARQAGIAFDRFATGHYARLRPDGTTGRIHLFRAANEGKDQSYFLALATQEQLRGLLLPLGSLGKDQVREIVAAAGFEALARTPESQDFLESARYTDLFDPTDSRPGDIVDLQGRVVGRHRGLVHYTVGQRRGLGLGGTGEPWYVVRLEPAENRVVVGRRTDVLAGRLTAVGANWIAWAEPPKREFRAACRVRQRHAPAAAQIRVVSPDEFLVEFDEPQFAVTPGQIAAIYDGDDLLGAGTIDSVSPSDGTG
ncbi:MAG: tRNA 2-thiouridine(34) synthase MnmA [Kiritimatiellae bacterium]|nr:tRNA 2-thiouridine(34) synthase MnmA [Kiritimatiellia bacterium]